ncbi:winged helix-turn-helix domain-containing protein [Metabacillus sp. GX 13764]|uniref:ArsR/SmtB family transcription factor n=1 Tax=Metabacillus kandeliae TaxID=2900151 RepID=UPI001E4CB1EE|nr:winged helix-turn-helix domain-containing protein [Metabacillus kandeliae]MCD7035234.1 winged helix-turn-helix domain-containing protein [Metabacillus kandeliae]
MAPVIKYLHMKEINDLLTILEALSNPYRMKIIAELLHERQYVSQLARNLGISRPLLYLHLQKLEEAGLVKGSLEMSEDGKAMKYYGLIPFHISLTEKLVAEAAAHLPEKTS